MLTNTHTTLSSQPQTLQSRLITHRKAQFPPQPPWLRFNSDPAVSNTPPLCIERMTLPPSFFPVPRRREGVYKSPKNGNFRERGKRPLPVTRTYYRQAERCAVCLTSGPAASFVPAPCKDTRVGSCTRAGRGGGKGSGHHRPFIDLQTRPRSFDTAFDHTLARHQDLWRFSTPSPRLDHFRSPHRDLLPIPIASLDCNYTVTVCMACQNFPRSINGFNGISFSSVYCLPFLFHDESFPGKFLERFRSILLIRRKWWKRLFLSFVSRNNQDME